MSVCVCVRVSRMGECGCCRGHICDVSEMCDGEMYALRDAVGPSFFVDRDE